MGDESEELVLKVADGPKTTIQPVVPTAPVTASADAGRAPCRRRGAVPQARDVAEVLAERRRAARAAELAAQGLPPGTPIPQAARHGRDARPTCRPCRRATRNSNDPALAERLPALPAARADDARASLAIIARIARAPRTTSHTQQQ